MKKKENMEKITFEYELCSDEEIREHIRNAEGKHVQQVAFSTYMDCITQIDFTDRKIRSGIKLSGNTSRKESNDR